MEPEQVSSSQFSEPEGQKAYTSDVQPQQSGKDTIDTSEWIEPEATSADEIQPAWPRNKQDNRDVSEWDNAHKPKKKVGRPTKAEKGQQINRPVRASERLALKRQQK